MQSWSLLAREARRGGADDEGGEGPGHEAWGEEQDRLSVMEDWVTELTAQVEYLQVY